MVHLSNSLIQCHAFSEHHLTELLFYSTYQYSFFLSFIHNLDHQKHLNICISFLHRECCMEKYPCSGTRSAQSHTNPMLHAGTSLVWLEANLHVHESGQLPPLDFRKSLINPISFWTSYENGNPPFLQTKNLGGNCKSK